MIKIAGIVISTLMLAGCANIEQQRKASEQAAMNAICDASSQDARVSSLRPAVALDAGSATVQQLSDPSLFSDKQKKALADWDSVAAPCVSAQSAFFHNWGGAESARIYQEWRQRDRLIRSQAFSGALTVGQFNSERLKLFQNGSAALQRATQVHAENLARQEAAGWAALSQSLQQMQQNQALQQQQQMYMMQQNRPVTTNCSRLGNYVNCTSW